MLSLSAIMAAIKTALAANHGTNMDLSGEGQVLRGRYASPPAGRLPFASVASPAIESTQGPPTRTYTRTCVVDIAAWAACTATTTDTRTTESETYVSKLLNALETAKATPGNTLYDLRNFRARAVVLDSDKDPVPRGMLQVFIVIEFAYHRDSGLSA